MTAAHPGINKPKELGQRTAALFFEEWRESVGKLCSQIRHLAASESFAEVVQDRSDNDGCTFGICGPSRFDDVVFVPVLPVWQGIQCLEGLLCRGTFGGIFDEFRLRSGEPQTLECLLSTEFITRGHLKLFLLSRKRRISDRRLNSSVAKPS